MFCFIQTFTLTSRSLHLPVGGQLISSISFEMFGCQPFFFQKPGTWFSPSSGLSDSTFPDFIFFSFFASPQKYAALCHSASHLLFRSSSSAWALFYLPPGSPAGDYNLHHVCACVGHAVFSETTTVTHFW